MFQKKIQHQLARFIDSQVVDSGIVEHGCTALQSLVEKIAANGGLLAFDTFMDHALYEPGLGYYSSGSQKLGPGGDFITAPEISPFFAQVLAQSMLSYLQAKGGDILEFGAGLGTLACDLLLALDALNAMPSHYYIVEVSADLRARQQALITERAPQLSRCVHWLEQLPDNFSGVVLANEVIDAMPACIFNATQSGISELGIRYDESSQDLMWQSMPAREPLQAWYQEKKALFSLSDTREYRSELRFNVQPWLSSVQAMLSQGLVYLIDYGYGEKEYYHPQRHDGTLMCYFRQRQHNDPLCLVGLQDITCHVDFSAVANYAVSGGLQVRAYDSQANFLLNNNILALAENMPAASMRGQLERSQQLKRLLNPGAMGEVFKVMILAKDYHEPLAGCRPRDLRVTL